MKRLTDDALFRVAFALIAFAILFAMLGLSRLAQAQTIDHLRADAIGACTPSGTLGTGETRAVFCALPHAEGAPLGASIETGSLAVQGHVVRATGSTVLVALTNFSGAPAALTFARIRLFHAAAATPRVPVDPLFERCVALALSHGDSAPDCHLGPIQHGPASEVAASDAG